MDKKPNIYNFNLTQLTENLVGKGFPKFAAKQVFDWVYRKEISDIEQWSNISKSLRSYVTESFSLNLPSILWEGLSSDGTRKFLIKFDDGQTVESVMIPAPGRKTLCISTQVGCNMACTFCHTGTQGLFRNLQAFEILGQFIVISRWLRNLNPEDRLTNIVYMGQGEPLHNFKQVKIATENFVEPMGLGLAPRRITLSTSGLVPQINKLNTFPPINLAISLHSPNDKTRSEIMPVNDLYGIEQLFEALDKFPLRNRQKITYEYLLMAGINDSLKDAKDLVKLLAHRKAKINLIPYNEFPGGTYKRPSDQQVELFSNYLIDHGLVSTVRKTKGHDILAACGQLKGHADKLNTWSDLQVNE